MHECECSSYLSNSLHIFTSKINVTSQFELHFTYTSTNSVQISMNRCSRSLLSLGILTPSCSQMIWKTGEHPPPNTFPGCGDVPNDQNHDTLFFLFFFFSFPFLLSVFLSQVNLGGSLSFFFKYNQ